MKKLLLILICLLVFSCSENQSVKFLKCVFYEHEHQPDIKRLVNSFNFDQKNEWLYFENKNEWYEKNKEFKNIQTSLILKDGYYSFIMKLESKDNYKETRLIKLSKSFDEIVYQKTLNLFNEKIIKRKGSCKEINKMEFYVNYKPEKKPITHKNLYPHYSESPLKDKE